MRVLQIICCVLLTMALGCGSNSPDYYEANKSQGESQQAQTTSEAKIDACRDQFRRAFDASNPELMGLHADRTTSLLYIREWQRDCGGKQSVNVKLDTAFLERYLGKESVDYAIKKEFDGRDVTHLRDAQLCYKLANMVSQKANTTLEKVLSIHEFAVNAVVITPGFESTVPRSCFEILKFGRGSKNDRVWVFANLLRQLHLDTFLVVGKPSPGDQEQTVSPLVGVLLDGQTYLFDVLCSVPIPAEDDPRQSFVTKPATLEELMANPKLIEGMFKGVKTFHPLATYDFSAPRILLISTSSFYAPRMKDVQLEMTGISPAVVYDDLSGADNSQRERIYQGVKQKIKLEDIGIWSYPETMTQRFENPEAADLANFKIWDSPFEMTSETIRTSQDVDENVQQKLTKEKQFLQARINQLNGNTSDALSIFGKIRLVSVAPVSPDDTDEIKREKLLKLRMSMDSSFWITVAQAHNLKYRTAYENALIFINRYPLNEFTPAAVTLAATSLAHEKRMQDAMEVMEKNLTPEQNPDFNRSLFYYVWWGLKLDPQKFQDLLEAPDKPENPPTQPATDSTSKNMTEGNTSPITEKPVPEKSPETTPISPSPENKPATPTEPGKPEGEASEKPSQTSGESAPKSSE